MKKIIMFIILLIFIPFFIVIIYNKNYKEIELNSKLSEAEVIFLNMKPLIKGLNNIKTFDSNGGSTNE